MRKCGIILVAIGLILLIFQFNYKKSLDNINEENVNTYIEETSVIEEQTIENNKEETKTDYKEKNEITYTAILEIPKINLKRGVVDSTKTLNQLIMQLVLIIVVIIQMKMAILFYIHIRAIVVLLFLID